MAGNAFKPGDEIIPLRDLGPHPKYKPLTVSSFIGGSIHARTENGVTIGVNISKVFKLPDLKRGDKVRLIPRFTDENNNGPHGILLSESVESDRFNVFDISSNPINGTCILRDTGTREVFRADTAWLSKVDKLSKGERVLVLPATSFTGEFTSMSFPRTMESSIGCVAVIDIIETGGEDKYFLKGLPEELEDYAFVREWLVRVKSNNLKEGQYVRVLDPFKLEDMANAGAVDGMAKHIGKIYKIIKVRDDYAYLEGTNFIWSYNWLEPIISANHDEPKKGLRICTVNNGSFELMEIKKLRKKLNSARKR